MKLVSSPSLPPQPPTLFRLWTPPKLIPAPIYERMRAHTN